MLVVDDEPAVRHVLRRYLDRRGWQVSEATTAAQALVMLVACTTSFDAVIVDLNLPDLPGSTLCRRIIALCPLLASRLIVASGDACGASEQLALESLSCPVLAKPFELAALDDALAALLVTAAV